MNIAVPDNQPLTAANNVYSILPSNDGDNGRVAILIQIDEFCMKHELFIKNDEFCNTNDDFNAKFQAVNKVGYTPYPENGWFKIGIKVK